MLLLRKQQNKIFWDLFGYYVLKLSYYESQGNNYFHKFAQLLFLSLDSQPLIQIQCTQIVQIHSNLGSDTFLNIVFPDTVTF